MTRTPEDYTNEIVTEHQEKWWGLQKCRRCNMAGIPAEEWPHITECEDCTGLGWTEWAALAREPWSMIVPGLWQGGHDWMQVHPDGSRTVESAGPGYHFDFVVSAYERSAHLNPPTGVSHLITRFPDGPLDAKAEKKAKHAADLAAYQVDRGKKVLVRCQAGLNRAGLITGLTLINLGYSPEEAIDLIREYRSPWALCNEDYEQYLLDQA